MNIKQIGITLITGFLGAGKTSLLNQIIKNEKNDKFAVIENEFSQLGIDSELIKGVEQKNIIELSNGCICCTKNTELQETMIQLLESGMKFNHVLIETTGIAEPDSIIQSIVSNPDLKSIFYIDSVVCLVDSVHHKLNMEKSESVKQIAISDLIIMNKTELLQSNEIELIEAEIRNLNPVSTIIKTSFGEYKGFNIINRNSFDYAEFEKAFDKLKNNFKVFPDNPNHSQSIGLLIDGDFIEEKFKFWMEYFLMLNQNNIYRAKGILSFKGNSHKIVFQAVKASYTLDEGDLWPSKNKTNRIIFIGKDLENLNIKENLELLMHD